MTNSFDPEKDKLNRARHGLSLAFGHDVLEGRVTEFEDDRFDYGERRMVCFGDVDGRLYACVYTVRADGPRIISVRKANDREQKRFDPR